MTPGLGLNLGLGPGRGGRAFAYLLRDLFTTPRAAGALNGTPAEPGPGTRTVTDAGNRLSIPGSELYLATHAVTAQASLLSAVLAHAAGRACLFQAKADAGGNATGYSGFAAGPAVMTAGYLRAANGAVVALGPLDTVEVGAYRNFTIVRRAAGGAFYIKGNALIWVDNAANLAAMEVGLTCADISDTLRMRDLRVVDLAGYDGRFATDFGLATNRLTNPTAWVTATHTPDCLWEASFTHVSGDSRSFQFRYTDNNNYWYVATDGANNLLLRQMTAGVDTVRATYAGVTAAAHRIVCIAVGNVYTVYLDNTSRLTYTDATNQGLAATTFRVGAVAGGVSEVVCWPATVGLPAGV